MISTLRIMELSLPRTFDPGSNSSIGGTFAPVSESDVELLLPNMNYHVIYMFNYWYFGVIVSK